MGIRHPAARSSRAPCGGKATTRGLPHRSRRQVRVSQPSPGTQGPDRHEVPPGGQAAAHPRQARRHRRRQLDRRVRPADRHLRRAERRHLRVAGPRRAPDRPRLQVLQGRQVHHVLGQARQRPASSTRRTSSAMDSLGRLFVADRVNNRIQIFDQDGHYLGEWRHGRPSGRYIDKNDIVYSRRPPVRRRRTGK